MSHNMSRRPVAAAIATRAIRHAIRPAIRVALLAAAIAPLASASAAWAYSPEAAKAAEAVLDLATNRQRIGSAPAWEVAAARYNVLDMKYRAKAISEEAFCKSAKPQLEIAVAALKSPPTDETRQWAAAIAAMDTDRAKCRAASAAADILLLDAESYGRSALSLEQAQELVKLTKERNEAGLVSNIDVDRAQYRLVVAELRAGKIDHAGYCASALPVLQKLVDQLTRRIEEGAGSVPEVLAPIHQLIATEAECEGARQP